MKALIIASDEGARLRPLTLVLPVAMTEVLGVPFAEMLIGKLVESGVREVCIKTGFMSGSICEFFKDESVFGLDDLFFLKDVDTKSLEEFAAGDELLVIDGSAAEDIDYKALQTALRKTDKEIVVSESCAIFAPAAYDIAAECIKAAEENADGFSSAVRIKCPGRFFELSGERFYCGLETPRDYIHVNLAAASGQIKNGFKAERGSITVGETSILPDSAELTGTVFIGENCIVGKNTVISNSIIGDGCVIGNNCNVSGSVVLKNVKIGSGSKVAESVICCQAKLEKGVCCDEGVIGSGAVAGEGSTVCRGVRLWPSVETEPESIVRRSIIGTPHEEELVFKEKGIDGELLTKRLPSEAMTRLGCAVGNVFGFGATIVVCSNAHGASQMLSSAVISGLMSTGIKVKRAVDVDLAVIRWVCRNGAADGAVYIDNRGELTLTLLDKHGNDLPAHMRRKIQRAYSCEEFTVAAETDMLPPEPLSDPEDYYVADIGKQFPYAYRAFRLRNFICGRERREAITAYIIGKLYPEAPIFVSVNSALAAKNVAEQMNRQIIKCGGKIGDVMEAMEPFMRMPGVYCQYLMLYDDFAFELALCHYKAVTGEDADNPDNPLIQGVVVKRRCSIKCDKNRKREILKRVSRDFDERFGESAEKMDGLFSWNTKGAVRISADERKPVFNISVESFDEEYAADMMSGLSSFFAGL